MLEQEYSGLTLIENPYYDTCNNISSLYVARDHLSDVIILDGDQIIYDPSILAPEFERSGYNGVWTDTDTDEWLMTVEDGIVTALISKEEAEAAEIDTFVESKFGGSLPAFVAAFTKRKDVTEKDLDEMQRMIDRIRRGGE